MEYKDIQGWFEAMEIYHAQVVRAKPGARFVEVGCWKGKSTAYMASQIQKYSKDIEFFTVDHFKGAPDHRFNGTTEGVTGIKEEFEENMRACGVWDFIKAIDGESVETAEMFEDESLDFVFIDGDHRAEYVYSDLRAWWPKVKRGGLIMGHDFDEGGPKAGAILFASEKSVALFGDGAYGPNGYRCFGIPKPRAEPVKIYLALPNYDGTAHSRSSIVATACTYSGTGRVIPQDQGSSNLPGNFNDHWCKALNDPTITHFAMLHADVVPMTWWLDVLMHEMDACDLQMISVVIPIKDKFGVTSTGIANPGNDWTPLRRFTMKEIMTMPATFNARQVGYPDHEIVLNTGCWLADIRDPRWRTVERGELAAHFKFKTRVTPIGDKFFGWSESEDFYFSKRVQRLGMQVAATRKVQVSHYGVAAWQNEGSIGEWAQDDATKPIWSDEPDETSDWAHYCKAVKEEKQETEPDEEIPLAGISGGAGLRVCSDGTE